MGGCSAEGIGTEDNEDQGQRTEVDVGVPGGTGSAAALFCAVVAGGVRVVCAGVRGRRFCDREPVHAAEELGSCGGTSRGQQPRGGEFRAAWNVGGGRPGAATAAAAGFRDGADNLTASG